MSAQTVEVPVGRLHCADCLRTLTEVVLPRIDGVSDVTVEGETIRILTDPDTVGEDELLGKLTEAGLITP